MRSLGVLLWLLAAGCAGSEAQTKADPPPADTPPPDLRTRKTGSDWPCFLGPTGDSVSAEKGIIAPWPEKGLRIVWQKQLGQSYPMPTISRGRLFLFDRHGNTARPHCWKSEAGAPLWTFDYPTHYRDKYGYNGGPRCCPVVDDDRVF